MAAGSFCRFQKEKRVCNTVKENDCDNVEKFLNTLPHYYYEEITCICSDYADEGL